jgi:GNAT superfamily N-acetyltransferase
MGPDEDAAALLEAYQAQLRTHVHDPLPEGVQVEWDGPVQRTTGLGGRGWILYRDLGGLEGGELDELIARQVAFFADRGQEFEWKLHGHDLPADLPERLLAAGFVPEEPETVVIARVAEIAAEPVLPEGVAIREVVDREHMERIAELERAVYGRGEDYGWMDELAAEREADPEGLRFFVAEADDLAVSAAWARFPSGTEFVTYWGGATLPDWRGRGIYRALVAHRANLAAQCGRRYVEVDASDDSNPILQRLGFVPVTTTTPYVWSPDG